MSGGEDSSLSLDLPVAAPAVVCSIRSSDGQTSRIVLEVGVGSEADKLLLTVGNCKVGGWEEEDTVETRTTNKKFSEASLKLVLN